MSKKIMISVLLIILLSLVSYFNIFGNEFVWDDHVFILDNADIRSFSNLPLFFSQDVDGLYRPLRSLHYAFIYSLAGKNEFLYHFNGLFLHIVISILVFLIIFEIVGRRNIALITALIFAVHPIHTGRVTNITAGFDLFGIFFMLLAFYFYVKFSKLNLKKYFLFSLLFFLIAVFSSEEAIVLPLIIILYEFCFNREKFNKKGLKNNIIKNYLPYFVIALFYIIVRFFVIGVKGRLEEYLAGNFFLTMLTMFKVYVYYIYLLIIPVNLTLFREVEAVVSIFDFKVLLSFLILASIIILALKYYNKNKIIFFAVFWFFITLIPFSNILPLQVFMAERYLYVPSIAFSLLLSYLFISIFNYNFKNKNIVRYGVVVFIILLLSFYIFSMVNRNNDFKDNLTLWSKTVSTNPENSRAHDNLGFTYDHAGDVEKALEEFEISVRLQPDNFRALGNLGVAYAKLKRYNESIDVLEISIEIRKYYKTYDKLGLVYVELDMKDKAISQFKEAIKINHRYAKAHNDLATVYGRIGEFDLALLEFNEAIRIDRDYADAHYNLGVLLEFLKQNDLARKEFEIAFKLEPGNELYGKKIGR
jgi:tetratricopeptide (TPR) repeat protein